MTVHPDKPVFEMTGDQYELLPLPPGPSRMFRQMLGLMDPAPELVARPPEPAGVNEHQYSIFPELGAALKEKEAAPSDMIDDSSLHSLQEKLNPSVEALAALLHDEHEPPAQAPVEAVAPTPPWVFQPIMPEDTA